MPKNHRKLAKTHEQGGGGLKSLATMGTRTAPRANFHTREIEEKSYRSRVRTEGEQIKRLPVQNEPGKTPALPAKPAFQMTPD
ncbi:hypothetical protein AA0313_0096 [Acetobacter indonesiensis NRIC 0313]|uniref:Uncharacterized protein n=1 Tax=Acetobacter indonesiensis TaxID=104101 RepID=A0A6N3T5E1_9PROT|nr:hypothetical protein Abin_060_095 [Acetobacter indonesiensis]GBQ52943.1 hypothetical protein AA0313_0096 [Acetobacter indonesiensis NRIC 0313]GEN03134.1 hypothetical protein AIN02nite_11590 [Acetobacter indonesiensis]